MPAPLRSLVAAAVLLLPPCGGLAAAGTQADAAAAPAAEAPEAGRRPGSSPGDALLGEIPTVVSASRYEQGINEAPASTTIVTYDEIHRFGYRTLSDVLRNTRGFYVSYDRNYEYAGTRGFGRPGDYSNRILIMIDGHTHNDRWIGANYIGNDFGIDLDLVDRIEIVRGPASALYGSNALFAVVNVITRKAGDLQGASLQARGGSYGSGGLGLFYGRPLPRGGDLVLGASAHASEGQDLFFREFDGPATNFGVARGADGESFGNLFGRVRFGDWTLEGKGNVRRKQVPTGSFGTRFADSGTATFDSRHFVELRRERIGAGGIESFARIYYDAVDYYGDYVYDYPPVAVNRDEGGARWAGAELRRSGRVGRRQRVVAGAQYEYNLKVYQKTYDEPPLATVYQDQSFRYFNYSAYLQDEIALGPKALLNLGLRHDTYERFGHSTNPRLAFIVSPRRTTTLKALYGSAFRVPSIYELFYDDGGLAIKPNPDLRHEDIKTTELVWEQGLGRHASLVASAFRYRMEGLITQVTDPSDGLLQYRNVMKVTATGLEVEVSGRTAGGILWRGAMTQERAEDEGTGLILTNSPEQTGLASLALPLFGGRSDLAFQARFLSPRLTLLRDRTRGVHAFDLTFTSGSAWPGIDLTIGLRNLLDQKFGDPGANEHPEDQIPQDGRSYFVTLRHRF